MKMNNSIPYALIQPHLSFNEIRNNPGVYVPVNHPDERLICIEGDTIVERPALLWVSNYSIQVACEQAWQDKRFVSLNETFNITVNRS